MVSDSILVDPTGVEAAAGLLSRPKYIVGTQLIPKYNNMISTMLLKGVYHVVSLALKLPQSIGRSDEPFSPRGLHVHRKLVDVSVIAGCELEHLLYSVQRELSKVLQHALDELQQRPVSPSARDSARRLRLAFQNTLICSACCCCSVTTGGSSSTAIAGCFAADFVGPALSAVFRSL